MSHFKSVFNNSCVKVPVDPLSKMPTTEYERKAKRREQRAHKSKRCSIDSNSTVCTLTKAEIDARQVREFYQSIPDYKDVHHLDQDEFYSTLKYLRDKRQLMLGYSVAHIEDDNGTNGRNYERRLLETSECSKLAKCKVNDSLKSKYEQDRGALSATGGEYSSNIKKITDDIESILTDLNIAPEITGSVNEGRLSDCENELKQETSTKQLSPKNVSKMTPKEPSIRSESRNKRNHSACSISWNDLGPSNVNADEVDCRFNKYFSSANAKAGKERKCRSMPSSPMKVRRTLSPDVYRKSGITVPKPFKMTLRDSDERMRSSLHSLRQSMSSQPPPPAPPPPAPPPQGRPRRGRRRARPVPLESRVPLYEHILQDQAMRRAISKINSAAELQAQMRPFSFTEREELRPHRECTLRATPATVTAARNTFKARPIPKNLFSNYFYKKMREDDFYKSLNRRIRAEELLRGASLPPRMAARDKSGGRSHASTPAAAVLSDLPTDTASDLSDGKSRGRRSRGHHRRSKDAARPLHELITTTPQPFHFSTANRASRKACEETKKIYSKNCHRGSPPRGTAAGKAGAGAAAAAATESPRLPSASDVPSVSRSNLAAVLRIESTRRRLETEVARRLAEREQRAEQRWRDHVLRSKPAWQLVRNNYEEDIATRLQSRRDEERLRREQFLHQMELMYGRVRRQPLLFERHYSPGRPPAPPHAPRTSSRRGSSAPPRDTRTEAAETIDGHLMEYLSQMADEEKMFSGSDSLCDATCPKNG